jgi:hypothetical protein
MTNIEIPSEIRAKLAPMIVQCITTKLKESGVTVDEEAIRKLVNDENNKIEFPAVVVGRQGPDAALGGWHPTGRGPSYGCRK